MLRNRSWDKKTCKNSSMEASLQSTVAENVKGTDLLHYCSGGWTIFHYNFCVQQPDYSRLSHVRFHTKYPTPLFLILHEYLVHTKPERTTKPWTSLLETYRPKVAIQTGAFVVLENKELKHGRHGYERSHLNMNWWLYIYIYVHTDKYVHTHQHTDRLPKTTQLSWLEVY